MKQVIVVRKDLNMRKGKMAAQVAHASMKAILDTAVDFSIAGLHPVERLCIPLTPNIKQWLDDKFTKIVVSVDSEQELLDIAHNASAAGLLVGLVRDAGLTEFKGVPTYTAVAIGPNNPDKIDKITGQLKLI